MTRLLITALLVSVILVGRADASLCNLEPFTLDVPANCPIIVHKRSDNARAVMIALERDGQDVAVTPQVTSSATTLDVMYSTNQCGGLNDQHETRSEPYEILTVSLPGARPGDTFRITGLESSNSSGRIIATADACPPIEYAPWCVDNTIDCPDEAMTTDDDEAAGCSAGGHVVGAPMVLAFVFAFGRKRRRQSAT